MQSFLQDARYGARMLFKNPGFTITAILTLALGIGANTAIFSVVNAVLLRPLPYPEPQRLVSIYETNKQKAELRSAFSYPDFFDLRAQNSSFEQIASFYESSVTLTGIETPLNLQAIVTSADLFTVLKANPLLGRGFMAEDEQPGGTFAVVISHTLWQKQFGADPNIIGRSLKLNDRLYNIVGVMPAGFQYPISADPADLWITLAVDAIRTPDDAPVTENRGSHHFQVIGRLKPGVSLEQVEADVETIAAKLEQQYPKENTYRGMKVYPFHEDLVSDYGSALWIILGAVGCVLLIACANVANLLLARATVRHREIAIRAALGASRWQIIRQLLTESILLSFGGGVLGLLLAWWGTEALVRLIPDDLPRLSEINLDWWVLGFTFAISFTTGILFGLAPALQAAKIELTEAMKESARTGVSRHRARLRNILVIAEVAIAIVLLVGAGLLLQSYNKLQKVSLGFDPNNVVTASVELPDARYPKPEQIAQFYQQLLERVQATPGVTNASAIMPQPLSGNVFRTSVEFEGRTFAPGETPRTMFRANLLNYFDTMKIQMVNGRDFTKQDTDKSQMVCVVNEAFVKAYFPDENPIGKRVKPGISVTKETPWREIVGVVQNVKHLTLQRDFDPELYVPHTQVPLNSMGLVVRTDGDPKGMAKIIQAEVNALDKDVPVYNVKTMNQYLGSAIAQPRFNALLIGMFGLLALTLTAIGLYGVIAYSVAQRTQEIGIRMALGAQTTDVLKMVVRQGMILTCIGLVAGVAGAFYLTKLISTMLYNVSPTDRMTFLYAAAILLGVALIASFVPARRASRVNPVIALRDE